jgi:signal transduction histidine kinase
MILLFCVVMGLFLAISYFTIYSMFLDQTRSQVDANLINVAAPLVSQVSGQSGPPDLGALENSSQLIEIVDDQGNVLTRTSNFGNLSLPLGTLNPTARPLLRTSESSSGSFRTAILHFSTKSGSRWLVIAEPTEKIETVVKNVREESFGVWTVSLLFTTLLAVWYVHRSLAPIVSLADHAAALTIKIANSPAERFGEKLPSGSSGDEIGRLTENFNVLFERLDAASQQLRQFVSDAAHELRTPLAVLRGETQLLLSHQLRPEEYRDTLLVIDGELIVMSRMLEGLFTLSMADAGQLCLQRQALNLDEIIDEACGIAMPLARPKGIMLKKHVLYPVRLVGDQVLLRQVLLIFLDNAIKYSAPGTTITVGLAASEESARIQVTDQGSGITEEHMPHIFERFYRAAPQTSDESRSGGLGLAIASAIMRAHGGSILCKSQVGQGSTFTAVFPHTGPQH